MANTQNVEQTTNILQLLGSLPGAQKPYIQNLAGNAGFVGSLADLIEKRKNGTATKNDYLDVIQDAVIIGTSVAVMAGASPYYLAAGTVIGTINYLDRNDWDFDKVSEDVEDFANFIGFNTNTDDLYNELVDEFGDIFDDLPPILKIPSVSTNEDFRSPLVLDLNNDGITSLNLGKFLNLNLLVA